jgi:hypothetical protein
MRCLQCDYPLWNVRDRRCPDCGTNFAPSERNFERGGVRFLCPHCATGYFGTSAEGHLVPRRFACVKCAQEIDMDEMIVAPLDEAAYATAAPSEFGNRWLERRHAIRDYFWALREILLRPAQFGRSLPLAAPLAPAAGFFGIGVAISMTVNLLAQACIVGIFTGVLTAFAPNAANPFGATSVAQQFFQGLAFGIGLSFVSFVVESALAHLLLRNAGTRAGRVDYRRGSQVYLYGTGAGLALLSLQNVPCLGMLVALGWFGWSIYVIGTLLRETYGVSTQRAMWTMVGVRAASIAAMILVMCGSMFVVPQLFGLPAGFWNRVMQGQNQNAIGLALGSWRSNTGAWPPTPLDPFRSDSLGLTELLRHVGGANGGIGRLTANAAFFDDGTLFDAERESLLQRIPPNAPFRLGNAYFYYPVADTAPQAILAIVEVPRPVDMPDRAYRIITVARENYILARELQAEIDAENARRATLGLMPLPPLDALPDLLTTPAPPASPATP